MAGAGVFGGYHAAKFAAREGAVVAGVYDIDATRAEALAARHGAATFKDYAKFLQNIDAVIIAAPATSHFALAEEALDCKRHLFVEKPLALSADEADALVQHASAAGVVLQVGHQERYVCDAVGLFADARAPLRIECVRRVRRTGRCEDVSVAFDLMVHDIDIVQQLTKSAVRSLRAEGDEDDLVAELALDSGTLVSLAAGRCSEEPERRMTVAYDDHVKEFDFFNRILIDRTTGRRIGEFANGGTPLALCDPLAHGAGLFLAAIRGEPCAYVNGRDGRACVDWAERIEQAAGLSDLQAIDLREWMRA